MHLVRDLLLAVKPIPLLPLPPSLLAGGKLLEMRPLLLRLVCGVWRLGLPEADQVRYALYFPDILNTKFKFIRDIVRVHYLFDVPHVPDVHRVVVVHDCDLEVLLVVGESGGVGIAGVGGVGGHVGDRKALGHVNAGNKYSN